MLPKHSRRVGRVVAALGLAAVIGAATMPSAGAASNQVTQADAKNGFKNLTQMAAPKNCPSETGRTSNEIKIGAIIATSGQLGAAFGLSRPGLEARINQANNSGELGQYKIKLDYGDDGGTDQAKNLSEAQRLVESDGVWAMTEISSGDAGNAQYLYDKGIPVVGWQLADPVWGMYPNMFGYRWSVPPDAGTNFNSLVIDEVRELGGTKLAQVGLSLVSSTLGISQNETVMSKDKNAGVKQVYKNVDVSPTQTDFGAIAQQVKDSGADSVVAAMSTSQSLAFMQALKQAGANIKVPLLQGGYSPALAAAPASEGAYFPIQQTPFEASPQPAAMQDMIKALPASAPPSLQTAAGWLIGSMLVQGIKDAGISCPTRAALINNLRLEKAYTAGGFFPATNLSQVFGKQAACNFIVQAQGGKFVNALNGKELCASHFYKDKKLTQQFNTPTTTAAAPTTTAAR
jgi:ABC-type branched-subunit amino acid transport system substrate-binding protein